MSTGIAEKLYVDFVATPQFQARAMGGEYIHAYPVPGKDDLYEVLSVPVSSKIAPGDIVRVDVGVVQEIVQSGGARMMHLTVNKEYFHAGADWPIAVVADLMFVGCEVAWIHGSSYAVAAPEIVTNEMVDAVLANHATAKALTVWL